MRSRNLVALFAAAGLFSAAAFSCAAQTASGASRGQVLYQRTSDEQGNVTVQTGAAQETAFVRADATPRATDEERNAVTPTEFDLDVRLNTASQHLAVRTLLTVRNDGRKPLTRLPLQISSALNWERARVRGRDVALQVSTLNADADHTGQTHEALLALPEPLAPGAETQLDLSYAGVVSRSAQRMAALGAPQETALHSDWDGIGVEFTGLRGFGNVLWYPASAPPVILGDGSKLFDQIGEQKRRLAGARFHMRLTVEFPHEQAPTVALVNGRAMALNVVDRVMAGEGVAGVALGDTGPLRLGFEAPSLFLAIRKPFQAQNTVLWALPEHEANAQAWMEASARVAPFLQRWLGVRPRAQLNILDLPDALDAPFETGAMLATGIRPLSPDLLDGMMAHAQSHAWMQSPRAWLSEGVAHFLGALWLEKQLGREQALSALEAGRAALALAEPESPGAGPGQPLAQAISPVYYRTKAAYVLWMLRDVAGDAALSAALRAYDPAADQPAQSPGGDPSAGSFQHLLEQSGPRRNLTSFFQEWVESDKGLPEIAIDGAFPNEASAGQWLVSVSISNNGYVAAEIPVTVRSATASATQRVLAPARGKAVVRLLVQGKPIEAQANDGTVPETQATVHLLKLE